MANEVKELKVEVKTDVKAAKNPAALPPPFAIRRRVVLDGEDYLPGDEEKLRPLLSAENLAALCDQRAIARLEPKAERPVAVQAEAKASKV